VSAYTFKVDGDVYVVEADNHREALEKANKALALPRNFYAWYGVPSETEGPHFSATTGFWD
jgi:hypothetical protein